MIKRRSNLPHFIRGTLFLAISAIVIAGCKKKEETPAPVPPVPMPAKTQAAVPQKPVQVATTSARKSEKAKPTQMQSTSLKRAAATSELNLDFNNRRDPFKAFVQVPAANKGVPTGRHDRRKVVDALPIQSIDTEKFKVTGIITGLKENNALLVDPAGKGYVIREGMQIGTNGGVVKKITPVSVEVEESFRDDNGKTKKRLVKLALIRKK